MSVFPNHMNVEHRADGTHVSIDSRNQSFVQNPYAAYSALHAAGHPAFYWEEYGMWCFGGFDAVNALLRDRRFGRQILHVASRDELGWPERPAHLKNFDQVEQHSLLELEPPVHTRLRKLVNRAFVSRQVERLRPQLETLCDRLIDDFNGEPELLVDYATPLPLTTICNLLGVPTDYGPQLLDWSHAIVKMYVLDPSLEDQLAADRAAAEFASFLRDQIKRHKNDQPDDLLFALITAAEDGDRLTEDELISTVVVLLNAGHEATVHQMGNAVKSILESGVNPSKLFENQETSEATVEECLRHDAPLHMFTRYTLEDLRLEMDGVSLDLKKGQQIALLLGAANHDPRRFAEALTFKPGRDNQANVSFGAGIHFCIGAPLARLELQVGLATLFKRFPELKLKNTLSYRDIYHFHGLEAVHLQ